MRPGNRYTFYEKDLASYRGTFLESRTIKSSTFHYIYYRYNNKNAIKIIPSHHVIKALELKDILQDKVNLPDDVLSIIDKFL